ncbi:MAG TPA: hypothetical protein VGC18_14445 [Lacisediminihabitans sp.]|uniref:DUF2273 domain-containing protein n=1 Tax=Lacisediminihabitans sp. TaxID=2787631 RepID=UPI002ED9CA33
MTRTVVGMGVGAVLALTWIAFGFWAFVLVLVALAIGGGVGRIVDGKLDVHAVADAFRGKRSSS